MSSLPIELEVRAVTQKKDLPRLRRRLQDLGFRRSTITRRTSVMSFGYVTAFGETTRTTRKELVDIRCRITNGRTEVVGKIGDVHSHNRRELSIPLARKEMLAFAQLFGAMPFFSKVGSRHTENFTRDDITISHVCSVSGISYLEIEKMSDNAHEKEDLTLLQSIARDLGVTLIKRQKEFLDLCARLTIEDDWEFFGTDEDVARLNKEIKKIGSDRK